MDGKTIDMNPPQGDEKKGESLGSFTWFMLKLALIVLIFRSFVFSPFSIPSESMLPRLWNGDYLLAAKWSFGYSSNSLPFGAPLIPGRIFASSPERGDIVIFKHPVDNVDYIKRVIGLPGDMIEIRSGQVVLNSEPLKLRRIEDFTIPMSPNTNCARGGVADYGANGSLQCNYTQFEETLPSGKSYRVLDFGFSDADDRAPLIVPEGRLFVMGDNRDNSQDSRFEASPGHGVGLVPQENLVGRATLLMWSTDGSAEWIKPWTWFTAARWSRIGSAL